MSQDDLHPRRPRKWTSRVSEKQLRQMPGIVLSGSSEEEQIVKTWVFVCHTSHCCDSLQLWHCPVKAATGSEEQMSMVTFEEQLIYKTRFCKQAGFGFCSLPRPDITGAHYVSGPFSPSFCHWGQLLLASTFESVQPSSKITSRSASLELLIDNSVFQIAFT